LKHHDFVILWSNSVETFVVDVASDIRYRSKVLGESLFTFHSAMTHYIDQK